MILGGPSERAREVLLACCGSTRWVEEMLARRPFESTMDLQQAAAQAFDVLADTDWHEAFSAHPRIGEHKAAVSTGAQALSWSTREQAAVSATDDATKAALAEANRAYEARFGHIYLVFASGRSATELLADCTGRLANDARTELRVAAGEQRKITNLRLTRLAEAHP